MVEITRHRWIRSLALVGCLLAAAVSLSGCVVVPGHGYRSGYYHHYR